MPNAQIPRDGTLTSLLENSMMQRTREWWRIFFCHHLLCPLGRLAPQLPLFNTNQLVNHDLRVVVALWPPQSLLDSAQIPPRLFSQQRIHSISPSYKRYRATTPLLHLYLHSSAGHHSNLPLSINNKSWTVLVTPVRFPSQLHHLASSGETAVRGFSRHSFGCPSTPSMMHDTKLPTGFIPHDHDTSDI